ncbi:MAG: extracellular solute-binding protein [Spirochaetota bacterium]
MKKAAVSFLILLSLPLLVFAAGSREQTVSKEGKIGGSVNILAAWGGEEKDVFLESIKPFEDETGIKVEYEATSDLDAVLTTRLEAGNPPDISTVPIPGIMTNFAEADKLVALSTFIDMERIKKDYAQGWIDLGTVNGKLFGIFVKSALKGLMWYNPKQLKTEGISIPETWEELMNISKALADTGRTPWAIGIESGAASGWVGTDWIENIFLRIYGPQKYKDWYEGRLAWTSPEIKNAWQIWGKIIADEKMLYGGKQYVLSTNFIFAHAPIFSSPPKAYFNMQSSFIPGFIMQQFPTLKPAEGFNFFKFPTIDPKYAGAIQSAGDLVIMFNDTSQARAFIEYLASAHAQSYWVSSGFGLAPNRNVSLVFYPDAISKNMAGIVSGAGIVVFDASDLMKPEMNTAFWSAVMSYVQDPASLDSILQKLESLRKEIY